MQVNWILGESAIVTKYAIIWAVTSFRKFKSTVEHK